MAISPWEYNLTLTSPDGLHHAVIVNADEIAMGAPTSGELIIDGKIEVENCNPSAVWSNNSRYLAIPQWTDDRLQRLVVVDTETNKIIKSKHSYSVLVLNGFEETLINYIDSPNTKNKELEIDFTNMQ